VSVFETIAVCERRCVESCSTRIRRACRATQGRSPPSESPDHDRSPVGLPRSPKRWEAVSAIPLRSTLRADTMLSMIAVESGLLVFAAAGAISVRLVIEPFMSWLTDRAIRSERLRLAEMLGPIALEAELSGSSRSRRRREDDNDESETNGDAGTGDATAVTSVQQSPELSERFAPVLLEHYAYGLVRAKRHDSTSVLMSTLGGAVVLVGVGNLLLFANTAAAVTASAVSTGAGIVTNMIAVLFHRQAGQALKHMQEQTLSLRSDMRLETDSLQAVKLLDQIHDNQLRDRLRAGLVLRLSGATLPDFSSSPVLPAASSVETASATLASGSHLDQTSMAAAL
jgi:hypothetical protein